MSFKITRPHATNAIVYIKLEKVLKAAIVFKGIMIEWVTVKGYDEEFDRDLWAASKHMVFRKIQDHTHAAMLHFYSPTLPELAVKFFLVSESTLTENKIFVFFSSYTNDESILLHRFGSIAITNCLKSHAKNAAIGY